MIVVTMTTSTLSKKYIVLLDIDTFSIYILTGFFPICTTPAIRMIENTNMEAATVIDKTPVPDSNIKPLIAEVMRNAMLSVRILTWKTYEAALEPSMRKPLPNKSRVISFAAATSALNKSLITNSAMRDVMMPPMVASIWEPIRTRKFFAVITHLQLLVCE